MAQRGRPKGQKNKSPYIGVTLKDLNSIFKEDMVIKVASEYANILNIKPTTLEEIELLDVEKENEEISPDIQFVLKPAKQKGEDNLN